MQTPAVPEFSSCSTVPCMSGTTTSIACRIETWPHTVNELTLPIQFVSMLLDQSGRTDSRARPQCLACCFGHLVHLAFKGGRADRSNATEHRPATRI